MNKLLLHILLMLILTVTTSHASNLQLPVTGQTVSQSAGDDGALQTGKAWPVPRFSDNRNGTISDNLTGLVWSGDANPLSVRSSGGEITWQKALDEIKRLNAEAYLGFSDWRLPNLNELASLLHQGEPVQSTWLSRNGFSNTASGNYWSSSSFTRDPSRSWTVQMNSGSVATLAKSGNALVWPVRGASVLLPATGQTVCYDTTGLKIECAGTGQDGELRSGVSWSASRFADNGDGTITDNLTGLIWPKNANPAMDAQISRASDGSTLWFNALEFVAGLNSAAYLGFTDWRLPNRNELVSLVNYAETTPGVQLNMAGVSGFQERYWSSTSSAATTSNAWNVTMTGEVAERGKYDVQLGSYIWPVRGGIETLPVSVQSGGTQTKTLVKTVAAAAVTLSVTTTTLSAGTVGTVYSQTLAATGGATPYTWSKKSGTLPAGLTLSTAGVISGTPTTAGTSTFTVQVKDKSAKTATKSLSITVSVGVLAITTASLTDGYLTTAYSLTLAATGGKTAYTWSITSGTLPAGLTLAASTGVISGTPAVAGSGTVTVQVKDANATIVSKPLTLTVYALPAITTATLPAGGTGSAYSQTLAATGGKTPYAWSVSSGTLPAGLALNASTGVISGTPTTAATSSVTFKVTDANAKTATKALSMTVSSTPPTITSTTLADGYISASYNQTLAATGGKAPYTWSSTAGALPVGLSLSNAGVISGAPTTAGIYSFTVQVKDGNNSTTSAPLTITIIPAVSVTYTSLPSGNIGSTYNQTLAASGGKAPYTWSLTSGTLPPGLTLNTSTGAITGTPTAAGTTTFTVQVKDTSNNTASSTRYITINTPLIITTSTLHDGFKGIAYSTILSATGAVPPYIWSITDGSMPAGLSLDTSTGSISGTPTTTGTNNITVQVMDARNTVSSKTYTVNITDFGSISGTVTDKSTGATIQGVTVTLNLSGITNRNTSDFIYTCNGQPIVANDYGKIADNDDVKLGSSGRYNASAKMRNPYGVADPFTIRWNGLNAYSDGEYLAQSFKPTKSGTLNRVSFYFSDYSTPYGTQGGVYVLLKSSLGGDYGVYLANSAEKTITHGTLTGWVDFDFVVPVTVSAGQEYFIELQGKFATWSFMSGSAYYDTSAWGNGVQYPDGRSYQRSGGTWGQLVDSLAFRTYVDANPDITTTLPTQTINMHGAAPHEPNIYLSNISNGDLERCNMDYGINPTFFVSSNSADYNCTKTVTNGNNYYDQNGWITVTLKPDSSYYSFSEMDTTLIVTDQFSLTFNRTLTTVTDANGVYSFTDLPDGNYTLTFGTPVAVTSAGTLAPGQNISTAISIASLPQSVLQGTVLSSASSGALSGVTVTITDAYGSHTIQTDSSGYFQQFALHEGPFTATISSDGFTPMMITGILASLQTKDLGSLFLIPSTSSLPQITVSLPGDFASVQIGSAAVQNISVTNSSATNLTIGTIVRSALPFRLVSDACSGSTLTPGTSCRITVQFTPIAEGAFSASLAIPSNDPLHPVMSVSLSGNGIAEGYRLPHTGQTTCFRQGVPVGCSDTSGQDGNRVINPLSYEATTAQTAKDNNTGLSWERNAGATPSTWAQATDYCQNLSLDGNSGWRLPTFVELMTIVNYGQANPAISSDIFPGTVTGNYWTATADTINVGGTLTAAARVISFGYGDSSVSAKTDSAFVRCVKGASLAHNGFYTLDANTTTDLDTGLMWTKPDFVMGANWEETVSSSGMFPFAGYSDWRLPNIKELATYPFVMLHNAEWSSTTVNRTDTNGSYSQAFVYDTLAVSSDNKLAPSGNNGFNLQPRLVRGGNVPARDPWKITATPVALDFGYKDAGSVSTLDVHVSNSGSGALVIGTIPAASAPFTIVVDHCSGQTLAATASCTVTLSFASSAGGTFSSAVTVPSNDAANLALSIPLIGSAFRTTTGISGRVTDAVTSLSLTATVTLTDSQNTVRSTQSDATGAFSFDGVASGIYGGVISKAGYANFTFSGVINPGQALSTNAVLSPILPQISNLTISSITASSAQIIWSTDQPGTTSVDFGETASYGSTASDPALTTSHSITLTGLKPGSSYHFRASSANSFGISATAPDTTFATPVFSVTPVGDSGNVTIMEVSGLFDAKNTDGSYNDQPRKAIAAEYYKTHSDTDFMVFLSTFDYTMPEADAQGFYLPVKNDVQGINQAIANNTAAFGSAGKLQGTIDLGNVTSLAANPYGAKLDETLTTLSHELMHRFGAYVRYKNPDGTLNTALLGKDSAHWSYLLDTKGSLMYGNGWKDNGDGTFTSTAKQSGYSPLDLYLMGIIPKEQVPPMLLIDNPAIDKTKLPNLGDTISGTAKTVTIDDIIAAEGARIPDSTTAQKQFNVGFVLLSRAGDNTTAATQAIETLRKAWGGRLAEQTNGIGGISGITPSVSLVVDAPADGATITGPDVNISGTVINTSGAETGVTVNGMPATVSGSRFVLNHVPLQTGSNSITVTATDANGLTASATKSVTAQAGNYIRISSNIESGTGPLTVSLRLDGSFSVTKPTVNATGPVPSQLTASSSNEYTATLSAEGTYTFTVSALGPDGQTYSDSVTVTVVPMYQLENLLKAKWERIKGKIVAMDVEGVISYLPTIYQDEYRQELTALGNSLVLLNEYMTPINLVSESDGTATLQTSRTEQISGQPVTLEFPIYFIQENGIWKLNKF